MNSIIASQINGGNGTKARRAFDFYPTPPEVTVVLVRFLRLGGGLCVWEPACGDGDMVRALETCGLTVYGTDIRAGQDFLTRTHPDGVYKPYNWIITNPPFAQSEEFIRHAAQIGKPFALLLKSQYWHTAKRIQLFRDIPPSFVMPLTWRPDFLFKEHEKKASPLMDMMWCVWLMPQNRYIQTSYIPLDKPQKEATTHELLPTLRRENGG